ncbi:MAG: guanylate kinase [Ignavibacteriaceae bacterium]|nr:guanylate kinase [Ignavibacteriaceae bacterium]
MAERKGKILIISAPSGSGKTTILKRVLAVTPEVVYSVSATTRKPRNNEVHGRDYYFIGEDEFVDGIKENKFIEWEKVYDYYYGTYKHVLFDVINSGKNVLLEIDVKGALNIKKQFPEAISVFIIPPDIKSLEERLRNRRTESESDLKKRLDLAVHELGEKDKFDYRIINVDLETAVKETHDLILKIINKEN